MGISIEEFNRMAAESKKKKKDNSSLPFSITGKKRKTGAKSSRSRLIARCDTWFSKYIRLRDAEPNGYFRCISCGKVKAFRKADCGHFFSRSHMATRYDEDNCHAECGFCNRMSSEHLIGYQVNLIKKIGQQRFDLLNVRHNQTRHWSDFELEELCKHYKEEVKRLSKEKGIKI